MLIPLFLLLVANVASAIVLRTSGRWIVNNATEQRVKLRCANWAGHLEPRIPEGLQHQTPDYIANWVANSGFNCVRLTFSIDMALNINQSVSEAFTFGTPPEVLPQMTALYDQAVSKNQWLAQTTTLGAFSMVIKALEAKSIMVILSNQVSRASWCCSDSDGNGWWKVSMGKEPTNSEWFDPYEWYTGLATMANFAKAHSNVVGIAPRSGLRAMGKQLAMQHTHWLVHMSAATKIIGDAKPDLLIIVGGTDYGTDLSFPEATQLNGRNTVYEFNHYAWSWSPDDSKPVDPAQACHDRKEALGRKTGFFLEQNRPETRPLLLSEFGWTQNNPSAEEQAYAKCLVEYMIDNDAEWAYWALQGSYYIRGNQTDYDETYGLLKHDWSDWRDPTFTQTLGAMFNMTQGP